LIELIAVVQQIHALTGISMHLNMIAKINTILKKIEEGAGKNSKSKQNGSQLFLK
jgi:hypothetical protein